MDPACRLESLSVTRHTRICFKHFEGGLGATNANPVPTIFDFPENLQRKEVKPRQDPEGRRLKNASTTSKIQKASKRGNSKVRKCPDLVEQQEVHLEDNESCTGEETVNQDLLLVTRELNLSESLIGDQQNLLEKSQPVELNVSHDEIKDNILFHDKAVQTDLSADQITRMEQAHFKLQDRRGELKENFYGGSATRRFLSPVLYWLTFTFVSSHVIRFSQACCKFNEILGRKEQDTS